MPIKEIEGVVQSPVFDNNIFNVGAAVTVSGGCLGSLRNSYVCNGLIQKASPLNLEIVLIDNDGDRDDINVTIGAVVKGDTIIKLLNRG